MKAAFKEFSGKTKNKTPKKKPLICFMILIALLTEAESVILLYDV